MEQKVWMISLDEINQLVKQQDLLCRCETPISKSRIKCYPHEGGIPVSGFVGKQWVYFSCQKCGYDWALWKLLNKALRTWTRGIEPEALEKLRELSRARRLERCVETM